jgi:hypothetical protein
MSKRNIAKKKVPRKTRSAGPTIPEISAFPLIGATVEDAGIDIPPCFRRSGAACINF